ncbi:lasso RiPP family leader peptide-containing protein [Plantactinospora sonchi]|uniref:Lasso RiPP family leader peptide-containing protein n=1 Tax=Plantactinospora sonchi TaxID=1544735 RepID=A0ABU7S414_9ACTN
MDGQSTCYVSPRLVEVGGFAELTRFGNTGNYLDSILGGWWL